MKNNNTLTNYLNEHFYSRAQLLIRADIDEDTFTRLLELGVMPKCSYRLNVSQTVNSFFGDFTEQKDTEYFPRGYLDWLTFLLATKRLATKRLSAKVLAVKSPNQSQNESEAKELIFVAFCQRYKAQLAKLATLGFHLEVSAINADINQLLTQEWGHFIDGTYGLCTQSGSPEDIATKELMISFLKPFLEQEHQEHQEQKQDLTQEANEKSVQQQQLSVAVREKLTLAVNLLDKAVSLFAPHERKLSSREHIINQLRSKYNLA